MQHGQIGAIAKGPQHAAFIGIGIGQQRQRAVGVGGHDHRIEPRRARIGLQFHAMGQAADRPHRGRGVDRVGKGGRQTFDIGAAAAFDGAPRRARAQIEQAMVFAKTDERGRRLIGDHRHRGRPDRRRHRIKVIVAKRGAHPQPVQIIAQRHIVQIGQITRRLAIEPHQVGQHPPEPGRGQIALLRKQPAQITPGIFQPTLVQRNRKTHVGGPCRHAQMVKQRGQVGIGRRVVDDEPGVDRPALHLDRVAVPANTVAGFEHLHIMMTA